jgi:small ligand-binding sensory domain FIST
VHIFDSCFIFDENIISLADIELSKLMSAICLFNELPSCNNIQSTGCCILVAIVKACDLVVVCFLSSVLVEISDCFHFDFVKVPSYDRVAVYGFSFGAGQRFLLSPEPLVSAIPLPEVIKSITARAIPSYCLVFLPYKV